MQEHYSGRVIKGYELGECIGEGGFGVVYRAHQPMIKREVAVKIILPHHANKPEFIRRFESEAQLIARLEHPHVVPLYDYWRESSGAFLVMRWLRGGSVQDLIKQSGKIDYPAARRIIGQIAEALAVAHHQGIIHRDLKPENIMLDENGNAYLTDFGIAKDLVDSSSITQSNAIVGSPAYLSPEQIKGERVTPQSDIYALGVVLYEMLTGERPFDDRTPASLMYKHLSVPLPDPVEKTPHLPSMINDVIQRATAKESQDRYASVIELAREFRTLSEQAQDEARGVETAVFSTASDIMLPEPKNPYKGLRAFQQADSADFYGRETLVDRLLDRLSDDTPEARFMAVVGPSGSGKSSVVKAGLLPALRTGALPGSENWFLVEMVPGIDPMEELEAALLRIAVNPPESLLSQLNEDSRGLLRAMKRVLPNDGTELLLVIDQFEELFTLVDDEAQRLHFIDSLITAVTDPRSPIRVVITLRADFYDRPLNYNRFGDLIRKRTELVLPLNAEELERAIRGPAERVGIHPEDGLVTAMVADINDQPGTLPLLQYALTELFERRDGNVLTMHAYEDIGGAMGALARRADELYVGLGDDGQEAARQLFLRLVTLGEGTEDTRRRVLQPELLTIGDDAELMSMVIDGFGRYRLLTFDHDPTTRTATVEIAHEALIRQWHRLRDWLDDSRDELRTQRRISAAAEEWLLSGRDPSYLARGARLSQFENWFSTTNLSLNEEETAYLQASMDAREAQLAAETERLRRERELEQRSRNQLRILVTVTSVAAVIGLILAVFALNQSREADSARALAEESASIADASAQEARSLALAANARNALNEHDPVLALALIQEAYEANPTAPVEVMRVLAGTAYGPGALYRYEGHEGAVMATAFSYQARLSASGGADGTIRIWDNETGALNQTIDLGDRIITALDFHPRSSEVVAAADDGNLYLYDASTGEEIQRFNGHTDVVTSVDYSSDGTRIISGSLDQTIRLWNIRTGGELRQITGHTGIVLDVAFSPDDRYVVSGSGDATIADTQSDTEDRTVRVWDLSSGDELLRVKPPTGFIRAVAFSPNGDRVAAARWNSSVGGTIHVWNIQSGEEETRLFGHTDIIPALTFDQSGNHLISGSWDESLRVWDIATGTEIRRYDFFEDRILDVDVSENDEYALVGTGNLGSNEISLEFEQSDDTSTWVVDLVNRDLVDTLSGHEDWVWSLDVAPNGTLAATGSGTLRGDPSDPTVRVWNIRTGEQWFRLEGHTGTVEGMAFGPDSRYLLSGAWDGRVILWDAGTGNMVRQFGDTQRSMDGRVLDVAFHPDGELAASSSSDGIIALWDVERGEELRRFEGHDGSVADLAFSPDGSQLVSVSWDETARLWDVETGHEIRRFEGHDALINGVAFSPLGDTILTGSWDSTVRLWDIETGEEIRRFEGHDGNIQTVVYSPDGQIGASGASDTSVRMWDLATGQELRRFDGHTDWISGLAFTPNGRFLLSSAQDKTIKLWQIARTPDEILVWAADNRYIRELTCSERVQFRLDTTVCEQPS